jgi:enoyl-CoA hydratase
VLTVERRGPVLFVLIDRPAVHNALNAEVLAELERALDVAEDDTAVRALIVSGAGERAFCAGADLAELCGMGPDAAHAHLAHGQRVLRRVERLAKPTIAAVGGVALGGGFELALACTLTLASESASFALPEARLGLIPGYGGTQRLPRALGRRRALALMLSGDRLSAADAHAAGLLAAAPLPPGELIPTALALAERLAAGSARAIALIREAVDADAVSDEQLAHETALAALALSGADAAEGIAAFLDKRPPRFAP